MNPHVKKVIEKIFAVVYPLLKPYWVQKLLRNLGFKIPYINFAEKLDYRGTVDFSVNGKEIKIQSHNNLIEMYIFWYGVFGVWEQTQLRLWVKLVTGVNTILDVGANTGVYSLIGATNQKANIYAFEPVPAVQEQLFENIALNNIGNITVIPKLVGDKVGTETLYVPRKGWVDVSSVDKNFAQKFTRGDEMYELALEMITLDSFIDTINLPQEQMILFKIDVEGAELRVLAGMKRLLERGNILFTMELLNGEYFEDVAQKLPEKYYIYAIDDAKESVYKTRTFITTSSNYFITDIDYGEIISL